MQGTVTSLFIIGCLVGCLFTGITNGKWGRLTITHAGSIVLSIGATLQASSFGVPQLIVGRIVAGIGLGLITSNVIVWQSESAPRKVRGMLVASALSLLIVGQVIIPLMENPRLAMVLTSLYSFSHTGSTTRWQITLPV